MKHLSHIIKWLAILSAVSIFTACGNGNKSMKEVLVSLKQLTLSENLAISSRTDTLFAGNYGMVTADDNHHLFVTDNKNQRILEFNEQGQFIQQIGRQGTGPGEFRQIMTVIIRNDTLYATDGILRRVTLFMLPQGSFVRSVAFPKKIEGIQNPGIPGDFLALDNGSMGIVYTNPSGRYISDNMTEEEDHFYWLQTDAVTRRIPIPAFPGYKYFRIKNDRFLVSYVDPTGAFPVIKAWGNRFYFGRTDSLKIIAYRPDGSSVATYKLKISPPKVTRALKDSLTHRYFGRFIRARDLGRVLPVYRNFWIDDSGRVWVLLEHPGHKQNPMIVFQADGKPEWKTMIPDQLHVQCIQNNSVYGVWRDKKGKTRIVRYAVAFP